MTRFASPVTTSLAGAGLAVVCAFAATPQVAAQSDITPETLTDAHVRLAIDAIVEELYERKAPGRFWDPAEWTGAYGPESQAGGYTALAILALLHSGQSYQDPRLRDAIDWLTESNLEGTYAISCRAQAWAQLPAKFLPRLEADANLLMGGVDERQRGWAYEIPSRAPRSDNSLRQYGVLGLWEAAKRDIDVRPRFWRLLEESFIDSQRPEGGWNYRNNEDPPRGSMTAAGLTVLMITQDFLHGEDYLDAGRRRRPQAELTIERGMEWMDANFSATTHPGREGADYFYYMYGVERVGLASGYKFFGGHDWFREGAADLIRRLCAWESDKKAMRAEKDLRVDSLAFGLMFLSRGRVPVAIHKLQMPDTAWNNRPRDAAKLVDWISTHGESPVNWQIVGLDDEPEAWLDAPLLYLASHEPLPWADTVDDAVVAHRRQWKQYQRRLAQGDVAADETPPTPPDIPDLEKLRRYLDMGGLLVAVNEGTARGFAASVQRSAELLYPDYEWRTLPDDHFVYTMPQPIGKRRITLKALSNGVRELVILADRGDLSRSLQTRRKPEKAHYEQASNIYYYASELGRPRPRLTRHALAIDGASSTETRPVTIVRAAHEGNWNPEPQALPLLAKLLPQSVGIQANVTDAPLATIHQLEPRPALVVVNGIEAATFNEDQQEAIRAYVESGGVILFETPGGRGEFTASAEALATEMFGAGIQSLSRTRIISGRDLPGAARLHRIEYRPYALHVFGSRENAPRLRGMMIDGEPRLLFSREDISNGLLDQPVWGVSGYSASSARDLMTNIILHASGSSAP